MKSDNVTYIEGMPVNLVNKDEAVAYISHAIEVGEKLNVITPYASFWRIAEKDTEFAKAWKNADLALADGVSVLWAVKMYTYDYSKNTFFRFFQVLLYAFRDFGLIFIGEFEKKNNLRRVSGVDLVQSLLNKAVENHWKIYFLGGWDEHTEKFKMNMRNQYEGLQFSINEEITKVNVRTQKGNEILEKSVSVINNFDPEIIVVSFGPPFQEKWSSSHSRLLNANITINAGATIDFLSGRAKRAPRQFRKMGIEWVWRFFTQPTRIKRILYAFPYFPIRVMFSIMRDTHSKQNKV